MRAAYFSEEVNHVRSATSFRGKTALILLTFGNFNFDVAIRILQRILTLPVKS